MTNDTNEPSSGRQGFWGSPSVPRTDTEDRAVPAVWQGPDPELEPDQDTDPTAAPKEWEQPAPQAPDDQRGYIDDAELIEADALLPEARQQDDGGDQLGATQSVGTRRDPKDRRRRIAIGIACAVVALAVVYGVGVKRFGDHFVPRARIGEVDVSGKSAAEAAMALRKESVDYVCTLSAGDFSCAVTSEACGLDRDEDRMAAEGLESQNPYLWPLLILRDHDMPVEQGVVIDEELLAQTVGAAVDAYNAQTISDAGVSVVFDEEAGLYRAEGSVSGTALDAAAIVSAARDAISDLRPSVELDEDAVSHEATIEDLAAYRDSVAWANAVRTTDIALLVNGEQPESEYEDPLAATAALNAQLVTIGEGPKVVVDTEALSIWASDVVAPRVHYRDEYTDYKLDVERFVSEFSDRLAHGVVEGYEVPMYDQRRQEAKSRDYAYERGGWDSELGRYLDVDLEAQFARLFDDEGSVLWESAFVSGSMIAARSTITGTFNIQSKQTNTVLVGFDYDDDGKPDYMSYVNYWMPFYGGYGLHDATWREDFGGDLYYYEGSHGCINLPYDKAAELYDLIEVGDTVSVHW